MVRMMCNNKKHQPIKKNLKKIKHLKKYKRVTKKQKNLKKVKCQHGQKQRNK